MDGLRRRAFGFVAGVLACLALALAIPLVAGAAGSFSLLGSFVYDDVYGAIGDTALMSNRLETVTNSYGNQVDIVQEDLVSSEGDVLCSTVKAVGGSVDDKRITEFNIGNRVRNYFNIYSTSNSEQGEGKYGLLSYDGEVALEPVYDSLDFNHDESLIVVSTEDENEGAIALLDAETLQTIDEMTFPGASGLYAYFIEVDDGEFVLLNYSVNDDDAAGHVDHWFAFSETGFGDELPGQSSDSSQYAYKGVSSTGEEFSAYVNSDGDLVIECEGKTSIQSGPFSRYGISVYGDYVCAIKGDGEFHYSYKGEPATIFEGYNLLGALTEDSSYVYFCQRIQGGDYVLVDGDGTVRDLPQGYSYSSEVVDNYLYGHTENGELVVFDVDGREVYRYDFSELTTTEYSRVYLARWDRGYVIGYSRIEDGTYRGYNVYLDDAFNLITEGWDTSIYRAANKATLPDGSDAYVLWIGDSPDYGTVLGSGFKPVTIGGYELVIPGNPGQEMLYERAWNPISRASTDWYYARDPRTGKFGAVDASGEVALPFEYDSIVDCDSKGEGTLILVRKGDVWSFLDTAQTVEPDPGPVDPGTAAGYMHRLYNPYTGEHFYTADEGEFEGLVAVGWKDEGRGWTAPEVGAPVYRLYNPYVEGGDHHYTLSWDEVETLRDAGWEYEGVGWKSAPADTGVPLYRQYNPFATTGTHNYTTSKEENDSLVDAGWREEGVAWYGIK